MRQNWNSFHGSMYRTDWTIKPVLCIICALIIVLCQYDEPLIMCNRLYKYLVDEYVYSFLVEYSYAQSSTITYWALGKCHFLFDLGWFTYSFTYKCIFCYWKSIFGTTFKTWKSISYFNSYDLIDTKFRIHNLNQFLNAFSFWAYLLLLLYCMMLFYILCFFDRNIPRKDILC